MPRQPRVAPGGLIYHAMNRAVARLPLFQKEGDFEAFERVVVMALQKHPCRLLAYCIMPNHYHLIAVEPENQNNPSCTEALVHDIQTSLALYYNRHNKKYFYHEHRRVHEA